MGARRDVRCRDATQKVLTGLADSGNDGSSSFRIEGLEVETSVVQGEPFAVKADVEFEFGMCKVPVVQGGLLQ